MDKKALIIYASRTGNTEKITLKFRDTFIKNGWKCDLLKIDDKTDIEKDQPDYVKYDFLCAGSYVDKSLPSERLMDFMRSNKLNPHAPIGKGGIPVAHRKITIGPKKGIVFVTYGGAHMGPPEAIPALAFLHSELEHLRYVCIGKFSCPGKMFNRPTPGWWHTDIYKRPNERDLLRAELFIEEMLEWVR
jgi:hypothetical protein